MTTGGNRTSRNDLLPGIVAALLTAACAGPAVLPPDYGFRPGLMNPDHGQFATSGSAPEPPRAQPRHVRAPSPARLAAPGHKAQPARFPEPAPAPRPPQVLATSVPRAQSEPVRATQAPVVAPSGFDAGHALRATQRVDAAAALLGTPGLADRAFVAHVLRASGQDVDVERSQPYPKALFEKLTATAQVVEHKAARPGDLVFFRDTADLNGNGKPDDGVTMVGVVERVEGSRVVFIAQRANKVRRMAVDPTQPLVVRDAKDEVVNTRLVRWPGSQVPLTTGQCLTGYLRP